MIAGLDLGALLLIVAGLVGAHIVVILAIVGSIILPNPIRQLQRNGPPARWQLTPQPVTLGDGAAAWLFDNPTATHTVLVCHGRSRSKDWMLPLIARLVPTYSVLAIDFPSHGENRYGTTTVGLREAGTVGHALDWLQREGRERVLVYGVSMGGAAALLAVGNDETPGRQAVEAVVTDGTFDALTSVIQNIARRLPLPRYFHGAAFAIARAIIGVDPNAVRPVDLVEHITVPTLFLHGDRDPLVPTECADILAAAAPRGRALPYPGTHDRPDNADMQREVLRFFGDLT